MTETEKESAALVEDLLARAQAIDTAEDKESGQGKRGDAMPPDLATTRQQLARVPSAPQELEWVAKERMEQAARQQNTQNSKDSVRRRRSGGHVLSWRLMPEPREI